MAEIRIHTDRIISNIEKINNFAIEHDFKWTLITKVLSGHQATLKEILASPLIAKLHSVGDSRLSGLKAIRQIRPDLATMYIKPPVLKNAGAVVEYADISLNTSLETIQALNREAGLRKKRHRIIIMIEMGELREGILRDNILEFYSNVFQMENIEIIGLGTNLGCLYGIEPTYDKMVQLALYKLLLETRFQRDIPLISGGSSITLPLVLRKKPPSLNHFRIGEAVFLGTSPLNGKKFRDLHANCFEFQANILELEEKDVQPDGNITDANTGQLIELDENNTSSNFRALLDFGVLDVNVEDLEPFADNVKCIGSTSDISVYSLGSNLTSRQKRKYRVGARLRFKPNYMAVARLMSSRFVSKNIY